MEARCGCCSENGHNKSSCKQPLPLSNVRKVKRIQTHNSNAMNNFISLYRRSKKHHKNVDIIAELE